MSESGYKFAAILISTVFSLFKTSQMAEKVIDLIAPIGV